MKKLKLKLDGMKEMLTKEQMKKISGGYYNCYTCYTIISLGCGGGDGEESCCGSPQDCAYSYYNDPCIVSASCS